MPDIPFFNKPAWPPDRNHTRPISRVPLVEISNLLTPIRPRLITHPSNSSGQSTVTPSRASTASQSPAVTPKNTTPKQYRNGYKVTEKTPSYKPYAPPGQQRSGKRVRVDLAFRHDGFYLEAADPQTDEEWDCLAKEADIIPDDGSLRGFQTQCSNIVIGLGRDAVVIAPTGAGKSLLWILPLLVHTKGISLVITPYTSLGLEGQDRTKDLGLSSIFVYSEQKQREILESTARGDYRVVFVCVEMLESPSFSPVLYSESFQRRLMAIFVDEAHSAHEAANWRSAYKRIIQLRQVIGHHVPLVAISATLPSSYRNSLHEFAGLSEDYTMINLGNHRPELSTVVIPMENDISSFRDISFALPWGSGVNDVFQRTIIYCDDLDTLTSMFWWFQSRLAAMNLPVHLVDILHAGLTPRHQEKVLSDFRRGIVKFLLASEKVGVGMNFALVMRVIQYLVRGLTIVRWSQREGRGGRTAGTTSTGYLICEKRMLDSAEVSPTNPGNEDPGILELIQSDECCIKITDKYLENPPRSQPPTTCTHCSKPHCRPSLIPGREHQWIMENPGAVDLGGVQGLKTTITEKEEIYNHLVVWRLIHWRTHWRLQWPCYGPESLISDADLENVAKHAGHISAVDHLSKYTHILHTTQLHPPLFDALKAAVLAVTGSSLPIPQPLVELANSTPFPAMDSADTSQSHPESQRRRRQPGVGTLQPWENVVAFQ